MTDFSLNALRMRSTSSSRWMAEASRFRRRSRSASDGAEVGVDDPAGVFEAEGSLDIALVVKQVSGPDAVDNDGGTARTDTNFFPSFPGQPMAATLRSLNRPLRTDFQCTRYFSRSACLSGLGPSPYLNRLHPQSDISRCSHKTSLWRKGTLLCRPLSTHNPPPTKSPRGRVVSARELYAQRNRSLFMYTSAVVGTRFASLPCHIIYLELGIRR